MTWGYQSNAQKDLEVCYNNLDSYIDTLHAAITRSHPDYEAIGVGEDGHHTRQLNTALLQIENEFYSPIRPKRVARSGEIPLGALRRGGIEYVEVRCVDVNPYLPLGIDAEQAHFLDLFLAYCLLEESPPCDDDDRARINENMRRVVNRGREPGLELVTPRWRKATRGTGKRPARSNGATGNHAGRSQWLRPAHGQPRRTVGQGVGFRFDAFSKNPGTDAQRGHSLLPPGHELQ